MGDFWDIEAGAFAPHELPPADPAWDAEAGGSDVAEPDLRRALRGAADALGLLYTDMYAIAEDDDTLDDTDQYGTPGWPAGVLEWTGNWMYPEYGGAVKLKLPEDRLVVVLNALLNAQPGQGPPNRRPEHP